MKLYEQLGKVISKERDKQWKIKPRGKRLNIAISLIVLIVLRKHFSVS